MSARPRFKSKTSERVFDALLLEGLDDMLSLSWMEGIAALIYGEKPDHPGLVEPTVEGVRNLLEAEYAFVGDAVKDPADGLLMVKPWDMPLEATVARIEKEWNEIGKLQLGSILWLELTDKGREEAARLDASGYDPFKG